MHTKDPLTAPYVAGNDTKQRFKYYEDFVLLRPGSPTLSHTPLVHSDVAIPIAGDDE